MNNEPIQDKPSALIRFWNVICVWIGGPISPKRRAAIAREEEKQKKGKKLMKEKGSVNIPSKTFLEIFRA